MIKLDTKSAASARKIPVASPVSSIVAALTRCRLGALQGVATWATARPQLSAKFAFYFRLKRYAQFTKKHSLSLSLNHGRKKSQPTATWDENQLISKVCENNLSGYNIYNIFITLHLRGEPKRSPHTEILNRMQNIWFGAYFSMIYIFNCPESPREIRTH